MNSFIVASGYALRTRLAGRALPWDRPKRNSFLHQAGPAT
jgi:hypothetical protein